MRIVVDDVAAQQGGALSILQDFDSYIKDIDHTNEWIYLLSGKYIEERDNVKVLCFPEIKKSWIRRIFFDFFQTKKIVKRLKPDIFLSLQNTIPFGINCRKILYVHQPLPFQRVKNFSFFKKEERIYAVYQHIIVFLIKLSAKNADKVIVQTEWMKNAVQKFSQNVVKITPDVKADNSIDRYVFDRTHFFYPTSNVIYKNIDLIKKACNILDSKRLKYLVDITVDGRDNNQKNVSKNINFLGRIDRLEVFKRYRSSVLLFPSYIETFGYPLAEARACGSYILASDCEFSHELLDDYPSVKFFDPFSESELATLMEELIFRKINDTTSVIMLKNKKSRHCSWEVFYRNIFS